MNPELLAHKMSVLVTPIGVQPCNDNAKLHGLNVQSNCETIGIIKKLNFRIF